MNKYNKKYNHEIDDFIKEASNDIDNFKVKKSEINSFLNLKRAIKNIAGERTNDIMNYAWENKDVINKLKTENDFYFYITCFLLIKIQ